MSEQTEALLQAALQLTEDEQMELVEGLLAAQPAPPGIMSMDDPNAMDEIRRRAADNDPGIPWEQVQADVLASLHARNAR